MLLHAIYTTLNMHQLKKPQSHNFWRVYQIFSYNFYTHFFQICSHRLYNYKSLKTHTHTSHETTLWVKSPRLMKSTTSDYYIRFIRPVQAYKHTKLYQTLPSQFISIISIATNTRNFWIYFGFESVWIFKIWKESRVRELDLNTKNTRKHEKSNNQKCPKIFKISKNT